MKQAKAALQQFIASFGSLEEKREWSKSYLENELLQEGIYFQIRHELYEQVIFPVLLDGYQRRDPWSLRWLARTVNKIYRFEHLWKLIDMKTDKALLKEALEISPDDHEARKLLLSSTMNWLSYCIHEWPAGILYGMNGATFEECGEILEEVEDLKKLDHELRYSEFCADVESKVLQYRQRLMNRPSRNLGDNG